MHAHQIIASLVYIVSIKEEFVTKRFGFILSVLIICAYCGAVLYAETMDGKEVTLYTGKVIWLNQNEGKIQVKTEQNSTGTWKVKTDVPVFFKKT
jgi:hypothetical protein